MILGAESFSLSYWSESRNSLPGSKAPGDKGLNILFFIAQKDSLIKIGVIGGQGVTFPLFSFSHFFLGALRGALPPQTRPSLDSEAATMYKLKGKSSNMRTGQGFK